MSESWIVAIILGAPFVIALLLAAGYVAAMKDAHAAYLRRLDVKINGKFE